MSRLESSLVKCTQSLGPFPSTVRERERRENCYQPPRLKNTRKAIMKMLREPSMSQIMPV